MKYWLITYQQRWHGRADWQIANAVATDPGKWFVGVKQRNDEKAESVLLSATPISAAAYRALKETL